MFDIILIVLGFLTLTFLLTWTLYGFMYVLYALSFLPRYFRDPNYRHWR